MTEEEDGLVPGQLYRYDGEHLVPVEPQPGRKIPLTEDAWDALKRLRGRVAKKVGMRPELSLVASATIVSVQDTDWIVDEVIAYAARKYSEAATG